MIKYSRLWYKKIYDDFYAGLTLEGQKGARHDVKFILSKIKLPRKASILDVPCGRGRHSKILAKKGFSVVGIDIAPNNIKAARKGMPGNNPSFRTGDIRNLEKFHGKFDAVMNLFTSIGYFQTDRENEKAILELYRCVKKEGFLVIEILNGEALKKKFKSSDWFEKKDFFLLVRRELEKNGHYLRTEEFYIFKKTGKIRHQSHRLRIYSKDELVRILKKCGFRSVKVFDKFGAPLNRFKTWRYVYIARK